MGLSWANLASQKRSTCFGTSSSSATSLIVRNASGALSNALPPPWRDRAPAKLFGRLSPGERIVDALLHDVAGAKHQHAPRRDGNFLTCLRVASDALSLVTDAKGSERGQLYGVAALKTRHDLAEHQFHDFRGLVARQTHLLKHGFRQIGACQCLPAHMPTLPQSRDYSRC